MARGGDTGKDFAIQIIGSVSLPGKLKFSN